SLPEKQQIRFLRHLSIPVLTDMIQEMEREDQLKVLKKVGKERSRKVLDDMDNDDLASLVDDMSPERMKQFLAGMKKEESTIIQSMMSYPPETAGRIMTNRFVWIRHTFTVREAVDKLKTFAEFAETINYLYVTDEDKKLVGVVS